MLNEQKVVSGQSNSGIHASSACERRPLPPLAEAERLPSPDQVKESRGEDGAARDGGRVSV